MIRFACKAVLAVTSVTLAPAFAHHEEREWRQYRYEAPLQEAATQADRALGDIAADQALRMLGVPYRYGGDSPRSGFDCSGLVQYSYRRAGAVLPRTTDALRQASRPVRASGLQRGDLVFFHQQWKRNGHVGIYLGEGEFVHAPSSGGRVRRDSLQSPYWRKHFSHARRIEA